MELMGGKELGHSTPQPQSRPGEVSSTGGARMLESEIDKIVGQVQELFKGELEHRQLEKLKNSLTVAIKSNASHDSLSEMKQSGLSLQSRTPARTAAPPEPAKDQPPPAQLRRDRSKSKERRLRGKPPFKASLKYRKQYVPDDSFVMKQKIRDAASKSRERQASRSRERDQPTREPVDPPQDLKAVAGFRSTGKLEASSKYLKEAVPLKPCETDCGEDDLQLSAEEEAQEDGDDEQDDGGEEESNADGQEEDAGEEELEQDGSGELEEQEAGEEEEPGGEEEEQGDGQQDRQEDTQPIRQELHVERQPSVRHPTDPAEQSSRQTFTSAPKPTTQRRQSDPEAACADKPWPTKRAVDSKAISRGAEQIGVDFQAKKLEAASLRSPIKDRFSHDAADCWQSAKPDDTLEPDFSEIPVDIRIPEVGNITQSSVTKVHNVAPDEEDGIMAKDIFAAFESLQKQASESATVYGQRSSADKKDIGLKKLLEYKHNIDNLSEKDDSSLHSPSRAQRPEAASPLRQPQQTRPPNYAAEKTRRSGPAQTTGLASAPQKKTARPEAEKGTRFEPETDPCQIESLAARRERWLQTQAGCLAARQAATLLGSEAQDRLAVEEET